MSGNGILVALPRRHTASARDYIERSGLTDAEVAAQLNDRLVAPVVGSALVGLWRQEEAMPTPAALRLLSRLTPRARPAALARVS